MSIYDLQGLQNDSELGPLESSGWSVTCQVPSPEHSSLSITCHD